MKKCLPVFKSVLKSEFSHVLRQSKTLLLLFFIVMLYETVLSSVKSVSAETGFALGAFEPFILLCTRSTNIILVPLIYLILLGGFPFCRTQYFQMIRTGKRAWLVGELAFVAISALAVTLVILLASDLFLYGFIENSTTWSDFMKSTRPNFPEIYERNKLLFLDASIISHGKPLGVMIYTFGAMWAYLIISGVCVLFGTIIGRRLAAMITAMSATVLGGLAIYFSGAVKWIFPLAHVEYGLHFNSIFSAVHFPIWGSVLYLAALLAGLVTACFLSLNKMRIDDEL